MREVQSLSLETFVQSSLSGLKAVVQLYTPPVDRGAITHERNTSFLKLETEQKLPLSRSLGSDKTIPMAVLHITRNDSFSMKYRNILGGKNYNSNNKPQQSKYGPATHYKKNERYHNMKINTTTSYRLMLILPE